MKRRFEPITSQIMDQIEKEANHRRHMQKLSNTRHIIDTSQPEISPRHRIIAQKAEKRHSEFLKTSSKRLNDKELSKDSILSTSQKAFTARSVVSNPNGKKRKEIPTQQEADIVNPYTLSIFPYSVNKTDNIMKSSSTKNTILLSSAQKVPSNIFYTLQDDPTMLEDDESLDSDISSISDEEYLYADSRADDEM